MIGSTTESWRMSIHFSPGQPFERRGPTGGIAVVGPELLGGADIDVTDSARPARAGADLARWFRSRRRHTPRRAPHADVPVSCQYHVRCCGGPPSLRCAARTRRLPARRVPLRTQALPSETFASAHISVDMLDSGPKMDATPDEQSEGRLWTHVARPRHDLIELDGIRLLTDPSWEAVSATGEVARLSPPTP